jgi:hypothetical protein
VPSLARFLLDSAKLPLPSTAYRVGTVIFYFFYFFSQRPQPANCSSFFQAVGGPSGKMTNQLTPKGKVRRRRLAQGPSEDRKWEKTGRKKEKAHMGGIQKKC